MKLLVLIAASTAVLLTLAGCGSFAKKPTTEEVIRDGRQVRIEMRFDASDMIDRISEAGCDISKVHTEASKRKDEITIDCRAPAGETAAGTKTIVVTP